jgi:surfeit locus 1 family protein
MTGFRPQFWPTVFAAPIVLLCLGLGAWQIQRLFWKEGLIAARAAAVAAAPVPASGIIAPERNTEFHHVTDEGAFLNDKEIFLGATSEGGRNGYQVLSPLKEPGGRIVFVNRGFIPSELKDRTKRMAGEPSGAVRIEGLLRLPPRMSSKMWRPFTSMPMRLPIPAAGPKVGLPDWSCRTITSNTRSRGFPWRLR